MPPVLHDYGLIVVGMMIGAVLLFVFADYVPERWCADRRRQKRDQRLEARLAERQITQFGQQTRLLLMEAALRRATKPSHASGGQAEDEIWDSFVENERPE